jgi:hypothetical protein
VFVPLTFTMCGAGLLARTANVMEFVNVTSSASSRRDVSAVPLPMETGPPLKAKGEVARNAPPPVMKAVPV